MLPGGVAVFGGHLASPVLLSPTVEVWLLLQLGLLLGGHHQHSIALATAFRVIWVFSLNRYINNKGRVRGGRGLTAPALIAGSSLAACLCFLDRRYKQLQAWEPAPTDEEGNRGPKPCHGKTKQENQPGTAFFSPGHEKRSHQVLLFSHWS